jgi:isoleucyl-tRNA synthetase
LRTKDAAMAGWFETLDQDELSDLLIVSTVSGLEFSLDDDVLAIDVGIARTTHHKCGRCWRHLPEVTEDGDLCARCEDVVAQMDAAQ